MSSIVAAAVLSVPAYDVLADAGKVVSLGGELITFMTTTPVGILFTIFVMGAVLTLIRKAFHTVPH